MSRKVTLFIMICVFRIMKKDVKAPEWIIVALLDKNIDGEGKYRGPPPAYTTTIGRA
jgi:hypothetical protein